MQTITFPGVRAVDRQELLINPPLEEGDITITIAGVRINLPFALVANGHAPIAFTLTDEQAASNGIVSIRDQSDPPEWVGPNDEVGPFNLLGNIASNVRKIPRAAEEIEAGEFRRRIAKETNAGDINEVFGPPAQES